MTATMAERTCPKCQGAVYDNRAENIDRAAAGQTLRPNFKCKSCDWVQWPPKNQKPTAPVSDPAPVTPPTRQAVTSGASEMDASTDALFLLYDVCYAHALSVAKRSKEKHDLGFTAEGVASVAATLFIAATKRGL